ncbi:MAG: response regulator [Anaerolineae bacterium]|nr:response regulator [Anaerolineae bacterium]
MQKKVLVVEDRRENIIFLTNNVLKPRGYDVITAADGETGLLKAEEEAPDIIILDLKLPRMGGLEVLEQLNKKGINIPTIVMTFHGSEEMAVRAFQMGIRDYLIKPFTFEEIENALAKASTPQEFSDSTLQEETKHSHSTQKTIKKNAIPYVAGAPITEPTMFFGRQDDLEKVLSLLTNNFVMLTGPRRIGKTSLLHQLAFYLPDLRDASEQFIPALINIEGTVETEFFHALIEEIVHVTQVYLPADIVTQLSFDMSSSAYPARSFSRDLQIILKSLRVTTPKPSHLVLLLDEMDTLNRFSLETQSQLRRIFQRFTNRNLSVVVAGVNLRQDWAGETSPFYNMFMPVILSPFPKADASQLITKPVEGTYIYSDEAVELILEVTAGLPHRIQQLCLETIHHLLVTSKGRTNEITAEHVGMVLQGISWLDESISEQNSKEQIDSINIELASIISHELQVPLEWMASDIEQIQVELDKSLSDQQSARVARIRSRVSQMRLIINNLLDTNRGEEDYVHLEIQDVQLQDVINEVVEAFDAQFKDKGLNLKLDLENKLPELQADYNCLVQIFSNLIGNACKYTPSGGNITISTQPYHKNFQGISVIIEDTGYGISEKDQLRLFTNFFRSSDKDIRNQPGAGIGLFITKKLVKAHGGEISFNSKYGKGSMFSVSIPL